MKVKKLIELLVMLARIHPLMSWSGASALIGVAVAIQAAGFTGVNWLLVPFAAIVMIGLQMVAHPINDLVDYPVDVRANVEGTGRHKPLISGVATRSHLTWISSTMVVILALLSIYVIIQVPVAAIYGVMGFVALYAYNLPPIKLSYRPFSEIIIAVIVQGSMVLGMCTVAIGHITPLAIMAAIMQVFMAMSMHANYFAMDVNSDFLGGKISSFVRFPTVCWEVAYPMMGMILAFMFTIPAIVPAANAAFIVSFIWFAVMTHYAYKANRIRKAAYKSVGYGEEHKQIEVWTKAGTAIRGELLMQMYTIMIHAVTLSMVLVFIR